MNAIQPTMAKWFWTYAMGRTMYEYNKTNPSWLQWRNHTSYFHLAPPRCSLYAAFTACSNQSSWSPSWKYFPRKRTCNESTHHCALKVWMFLMELAAEEDPLPCVDGCLELDKKAWLTLQKWAIQDSEAEQSGKELHAFWQGGAVRDCTKSCFFAFSDCK